MDKRAAPDESDDAQSAKRARVGGIPGILKKDASQASSVNTLAVRNSSTAVIEAARTSDLKSPNMALVGHGDAVHTVKFSHCGSHLASGSFDKMIYLWNVFGDCDNYGVLSGHKNAIQEVQWAVGNMNLLSASADKTLGWWDVETGERLRKLADHEAVVNSCHIAKDVENIFASASDDKTVKLWDPKQKGCTFSFDHDYQVMSARISADGQSMFSSGLDGVTRAWDVRKPLEPLFSLAGHKDIITGSDLSPDGSFLVTNAMDNEVCLWDVRPFVVGGDSARLVKKLSGSVHNFEKLLLKCSFSTNGQRVAAGSADATACVWGVAQGSLLYKLPGHKGPVREVVFHPTQPIIASCSSDKTVLVGEIA